jgi:hypothetical protein
MSKLTPDRLKVELLRRELARRHFLTFVPHIFPDYQMSWFHELVCDRLHEFAIGNIKKLMVCMPPQHGKSTLSTRSLPCYLFGLDANLRIAILSYSADKAHQFNREVQQRISSPRYQCLFPSVRLATAKDKAIVRTTQQFDIVGYDGSLKAVGREGPLTGDPVDIAILDDLLKDRQEAQSLTVRQSTWNWIVDVVETRLHNNSQMLYVTTRWDEDDPAGRFLERDGYYSEANKAGWVVINLPALRTADIVSYDPRPVGAALWPERHSLERIEAIKANSSLTFNSLYQQDPRPSTEAMVFPDWIEVDEFPACDVQFAGMDFGYSNDPTTLIRIGLTGKDMYLEELIYETGLTNPDILQRAHLTKIGVHIEIIADNAEPKSIEELRRGVTSADGQRLAGLNIKPCTKGPGSVNAGIQKLNEYRVHYTRRSLNIKREIRNYQWIMAGGVATNTPIDAYNHALDAVRSAVFTKYNYARSGNARATRPAGRRSVFD